MQPYKATAPGAIAYSQHRIPRQRICQPTGILSPVTAHSDQAEQPVARKCLYGQDRLLTA